MIEDVKAVALEIEFEDRADRVILAKELDFRGIAPMEADKWYRPESKNPGATLTHFLQRYLPGLLRKRPRRKGRDNSFA